MRSLKPFATVLVLLAVLAPSALAAGKTAPGGRIDKSFGKHGRLLVAATPEAAPSSRPELELSPTPVAAAALPGGKIVAATSHRVYVREADGKPAAGFGPGGSTEIVPPAGDRFILASVAVDSQGRILVGGTAESLSGSAGVMPVYNLQLPTPAAATVYRFLPDGELDPTFGTGGVASSTFEQPQPKSPVSFPYNGVITPHPAPAERINAMTVDSQDRPVLTGGSASRVEPCGDVSFEVYYFERSFTARFTASGGVDTSFGSNGALTSEAVEPATTLATGPDEEVAAGFPPNGCARGGSSDWVGTEVVSATGAGQARVEGPAEGVAIDAHGRILTARSGEIGRYRRNGEPDPNFGKNGHGSLAAASRLTVGALAIDSRERPLIAAAPPSLEGEPGQKVTVGRLTAVGKADPTFGSKGSVAVGFGAKATVIRPQLVLDGKRGIVVVAAVETKAVKTGYALAFARLTAG